MNFKDYKRTYEEVMNIKLTDKEFLDAYANERVRDYRLDTAPFLYRLLWNNLFILLGIVLGRLLS